MNEDEDAPYVPELAKYLPYKPGDGEVRITEITSSVSFSFNTFCKVCEFDETPGNHTGWLDAVGVIHSREVCPQMIRVGCHVYWGSHGCMLKHGHDGHHECDCCDCENHPDPDSGCVGKYPYYGPDTNFYGDDA